MKLKVYTSIFLIFLTFASCGQESPYPEFQFSNFEKTPYQGLALAVKNSDTTEIKWQISHNNLNIDFKEDKFNMSLLSLAIANHKKKSFDCLLRLGADVNIISGNEKDITPLILSIELSDGCNTYYLDKLLAYGGNPNFIFQYKHNDIIHKASPLFSAIKADDQNGNFCVETVKILCHNGAKIDIWEENRLTNFKEDVIYKCLFAKNMLALRYFIVDKKIEIPKYVYMKGGVTEESKKYFSLKEMLSSDEYKFEFYPENERAKQEILDFLNNN